MSLRQNLDDYMSIVCFKSAIKGMEDILGEEGTAAALIAAGRQRGRDVADSKGLTGSNPSVDTLQQALNKELGKEGTRLCSVVEISNTPNGGFLVKTAETVCMAGEPSSTRRTCTYTMGAVMGAIEAATGKKLIGKHVGNSAKGSATDDFQFDLMG